MKKALLLLSAASLFACVQQAEITSPPVNVVQTAGFASDDLRGFDAVEIRSFLQDDPEKSAAEVSGAQCTLQGSGFNAQFVTPSIVSVPNFGKASRNVSVNCTLNDKSVNQIVEINNLSAAKRVQATSSAGAGFGIVGVIVASAVATTQAGDQPGDLYGYTDIGITFGKE